MTAGSRIPGKILCRVRRAGNLQLGRPFSIPLVFFFHERVPDILDIHGAVLIGPFRPDPLVLLDRHVQVARADSGDPQVPTQYFSCKTPVL